MPSFFSLGRTTDCSLIHRWSWPQHVDKDQDRLHSTTQLCELTGLYLVRPAWQDCIWSDLPDRIVSGQTCLTAGLYPVRPAWQDCIWSDLPDRIVSGQTCPIGLYPVRPARQDCIRSDLPDRIVSGRICLTGLYPVRPAQQARDIVSRVKHPVNHFGYR